MSRKVKLLSNSSRNMHYTSTSSAVLSHNKTVVNQSFFSSTTALQNMSSHQRVVREVSEVTEGGVTKTITTETIYSSQDAIMPDLQARPGQTITTRKTITSTEGAADFPKEFSDKLCIGESESTYMEKKPATSSKPSTSKGSSSAEPSSPPSMDLFAKDCLAAHNKYRAIHGTPPLVLSASLNKFAAEWATKLAKEDKFEHRPDNKFGENIYLKFSSKPNFQVTGAEAVDSWYDEIKVHKFGQEPRSLASGHFTQVIWKTTKEMGVAFAKSKSGKILVVANYSPPGNLMGAFTLNVPGPKK